MEKVTGMPMGWKWAQGLVMSMLKGLSSEKEMVTQKPMR